MLFDPKKLVDELQVIHEMNLKIHHMYFPGGIKRSQVAHSGCFITSKERVVFDGLRNQRIGSAHEGLQAEAIRCDRDPMVESIFNRVRHLPGVHPEESFCVVKFGFTEAAGAAIDIRVDTMPIHVRPLTPKHMARRMADAERRLGFRAETGRARTWLLNSRKFVAATPEQALWKWIALEQPKVADKLMASGKANEQVRSLIKRGMLLEIFDMDKALDMVIAREPSTLL